MQSTEVNTVLGCTSKDKCFGDTHRHEGLCLLRFGELSPEVWPSLLSNPLKICWSWKHSFSICTTCFNILQLILLTPYIMRFLWLSRTAAVVSARIIKRDIILLMFVFYVVQKLKFYVLIRGILTWSLTLREERRLGVLQNRVLREILRTRRVRKIKLQRS